MTGIVKFLLSGAFCNAFRLLRIIPNNDPIMGCVLPFSKQDKWWYSPLFAFFTMISFDVITGMVGPWTIVTSLTYAGLGLLFYKVLRSKNARKTKVGLKKYLGCGITGVLIFDVITGVLAGPLMFGMSFELALLGQIPFTLLHLASACGFIVLITPLLDRHLIDSANFDDLFVWMKLKSFGGFILPQRMAGKK
jgi:hypothetical protein